MKLFILIFILFTGCGNETRKPESAAPPSVKKDTVKANTNSESRKDSLSPEVSNKSDGKLKKISYAIAGIPPDIKYSGSVVAMSNWDDRLGHNLLFITETKEITSDNEFRYKELYGYHYVMRDTGKSQLWKIHDLVQDCPLDITLHYLENSLKITDLNNNGIGESSFLYKMSCKGDVSPDNLKFIMHEEKDKYAIRGSMNQEMKGEPPEKGSMKVDSSFNNSPKEFLEFAKEQWNKYKNENIDD